MKGVVKTKWIVRVGPKAKIKCEIGDVVEQNQVILEEGNDILKVFDASVVLSKLSRDKIENINGSLKDKLLKMGDVICETGGLINKKIFVPVEGIFCGIDEFFNMTIRIEEQDRKTVRSPVKAKVAEKDKEKLVLEFRADEIKGKGIVPGRVWGESDFKEYGLMSELNYECEGKIIMVSNTDAMFITKAEVVGVVGLIVKDEKEIEADIPILKIGSADWDKLLQMGKENGLYRVLLNAKLDRLLIVKDKE